MASPTDDFPAASALARNLRAVSHFIERQWYPEERFPRTLFPDLPERLLAHFVHWARQRPDCWRALQRPLTEAPLAALAGAELTPQGLLEKHPDMLVLIHRRAIERFVAYKHRRHDERADIVQEIVTRLLERTISKIQSRFDFHRPDSPSLTSYLLVCVRNLYIDMMREEKQRVRHEEIGMDIRELPAPSIPPLGATILAEEGEKLRAVLALYGRARPKIELVLKIKFRLPLTAAEVRRSLPGAAPEEVAVMIRDWRGVPDRQVYEAVTPVLGGSQQADSLRKWAHAKADEIVGHLNRDHAGPVYDQERLATLLALGTPIGGRP